MQIKISWSWFRLIGRLHKQNLRFFFLNNDYVTFELDAVKLLLWAEHWERDNVQIWQNIYLGFRNNWLKGLV